MVQPLRQAYRRYAKAIPNPAAGAELIITPDGQGGWRVVYLAFTFTASAAVANRNVALRATDGTLNTFEATQAGVQAAASAVRYVAYPGAVPAALAAGAVVLPMPDEGIILGQSWQIRTATALIDVADQYSSVVVVVEELPSGPDWMAQATGLVDVQPLG